MTIKAITLGTLPDPVDILVKEAEAGAQSISYPDSKDEMSF
jgi:hypothetical protein